MALRTNTFEGGSDETVITTGNSGGASGDAFNVVATNTPATEPAFDNAHVLGTMAMRVAVTAAAADFCLVRWTALGDLTETYGRCYVYFTANPPSVATIASTQTTAGGQLGRVRVLTTGIVRIVDSTGTTIADSTIPVNLNAWTRLEYRYRTSPSDFACRIAASNPTGNTFDQEISGAMDVASLFGRAEFGHLQVLSSGSSTFWVDNVITGAPNWPGSGPTSADDPPIGFLGAGAGW